jgi:kynurenine formamidase
MIDQWRACFDAEVTFANGGGLRTEGFRLDLPGDDPATITDAELGALFVRHLGLLMVDRVTISNRTSLREPHKGSRGVQSQVAGEATAIIELSHVITAGMTTYPGLPGPEIDDHLSREASRDVYAAGTELQIGRITMVANTGTYLDTPSHRYADGVDLAGMPLSSMVDLDGVVVRVPDGVTAIDRLLLAPYDVAGRAVLIHTGWDRHWGTDAYGAGGHPHVTEDGADWLVSQGAALVGIDSVNIDSTAVKSRPVHSALLAARIPIVEHMCGLESLPPHGFRFHAAPPMVAGMGSFPVRAYAVVRSTATTNDVRAHSDSGAPSRQP